MAESERATLKIDLFAVTPPSRRPVPARCRRYDATPFSSPFRVWGTLMNGCSESKQGPVPFHHVILERSEESHVAGVESPHPAPTTKHGFVKGRRKHGLRTPKRDSKARRLSFTSPALQAEAREASPLHLLVPVRLPGLAGSLRLHACWRDGLR